MLYELAYEACRIISPEGVHVPTRVLHALTCCGSFRSEYASLLSAFAKGFQIVVRWHSWVCKIGRWIDESFGESLSTCREYNFTLLVKQCQCFLSKELYGVKGSLIRATINWIHKNVMVYKIWNSPLQWMSSACLVIGADGCHYTFPHFWENVTTEQYNKRSIQIGRKMKEGEPEEHPVTQSLLRRST